MGGQSGEGKRLTSDAPHNGRRHPPGDALPPPPEASNAGPQGRTLWNNQCWVPTPAPTAPGTHGSRCPSCPPQRTGGRGRDSATRRPSQRGQATPPGDSHRPPPRHAPPTGHTGQGDSVGPPHPHACAHSTWVVDPNSPPSERTVGGGGAPDIRRPSQQWKAPSPERPSANPHGERRRPARTHAVGPVQGPNARTDRTRDTRVAEPWLTAPEGGRLGEGQRLTPDAPRNGCGPPPPGGGPPPPPRHAAPTGHAGRGDGAGPAHLHAPAHSMWVVDPDGPPRWRATRGGAAPGTRRPSQQWRATPPGTAPTTPAERGPPRACKPRGQCRAPTPAHPRPRQGWGRTNSPPRGRTVGGGGAPDRRRPSPRTPYPHTRAHSTWAAGPDSPQEEGSRRGESARPRTLLATGPPQTAGRGEHLVPTRTHERRPAEPAYELPHPRPAAPTARAPATGNPHPTPCS